LSSEYEREVTAYKRRKRRVALLPANEARRELLPQTSFEQTGLATLKTALQTPVTGLDSRRARDSAGPLRL